MIAATSKRNFCVGNLIARWCVDTWSGCLRWGRRLLPQKEKQKTLRGDRLDRNRKWSKTLPIAFQWHSVGLRVGLRILWSLRITGAQQEARSKKSESSKDFRKRTSGRRVRLQTLDQHRKIFQQRPIRRRRKAVHGLSSWDYSQLLVLVRRCLCLQWGSTKKTSLNLSSLLSAV